MAQVESSDGFARASRVPPPRVPGGDLVIEAPPEVPRIVPGNIALKLLPLVMVASMIGMVALMLTSGAAANPMTLMFPAMMVVSMLGMFLGGGRGQGARGAEIDESRKDYLAYLDRLRAEVADTSAAQRAALLFAHPPPANLWTLAGTDRMWERSPSDPDFVQVRIGVGNQRLATRLVAPETGPLETLEPVSAASLRAFVRTRSVVADLPTAVSLRGFAAVAVDGERDAARALVRAMIVQLCSFHAPSDLAVIIVAGAGAEEEWEWIKWLPHARVPGRIDGAGPARAWYTTLSEATVDLVERTRSRGPFVKNQPAAVGVCHLVVIVDGTPADAARSSTPDVRPDWLSAGYESMTVVDLADVAVDLVAAQGIRFVLDGGSLGADSTAGVEIFGTADGLDGRRALAFARVMARHRPVDHDSLVDDVSLESSGQWNRLVGIDDPGDITPDTAWRPRRGRDRLRVPIGVAADGTAVELDLKEAAEGGMGPHGLCIGATGSGKSEFLRTLVLGLIATHSPDALNLVLVDFKGGATFLGLDGAPHVAAIITNLADERAMVERMRDALAGEMNRRQELLRGSGNFAGVSDYERARAGGRSLDPLPALFVVVDEFSELLTQYPDFAELFVAIGRLGRSLHIHLLLASQRLDEGRLRGLDSHLSYRIGLKTFSATESRSVLGVTDAYHLPARPGAGFLRTDASDLIRFTAAYVSGPYRRAAHRGAQVNAAPLAASSVRPFTAAPVPIPVGAAPLPAAPIDSGQPESTVLEAVVGCLRGHGMPAHRVWLPPLGGSPTLAEFGPAATRFDRVVLSVPVGVVDRPFDQRRDPLLIDVSGSHGNVALIGGPQSGKSIALRTLIVSLSRANSAAAVQFYCLDFGGGALAGLDELPHVGSVATRLDVDRVRRTVAETAALIRRREMLFRARGIESMAEYRELRAGGDLPTEMDPYGDLFLVIDGWSVVRSDFEPLEAVITRIAAEGLSFGVHVVIAASRWAEVRPALRDLLATRIELRLGDPADSDAGRVRAASVPERMPGRGITREGLHLLMALPREDGAGGTEGLGAALAPIVARARALEPHVSAPAVRLLPDQLDAADLVAQVAGPPNPDRVGRRVPIGVDEAELAPVFIDFDDSAHLLVFGDGGCGKTTVLRTVCEGLVRLGPPREVKIVLADYRRTLLGMVPEEHLGGYASTSTLLTTMLSELATVLRDRLPGPDTTGEQLRTRSWWTGPEVFVVVDDYDLVATSSSNPLTTIVEFLPQARDVGLHLIVARRSGGAARALFDPVLSRMKDLGSTGLIMSGNRDEGPLVGSVRPTEQPPGRGTLVRRGSGDLIQAAMVADAGVCGDPPSGAAS